MATCVPNSCTPLASELSALRAEKASLQEELKMAAPGEKAVIMAQIKSVSSQILKKQSQLDSCILQNGVVYRLPFGADPAWKLAKGNADDPINAHGANQAFAFDFAHDANGDGVGEEGFAILAARAGTVVGAVEDRSCNTWNKPPGDPCYKKPGTGNFVMIKHADGTVGVYCHLQKNSVVVTKGEAVEQGALLGLCGNTGNSSMPHLHFEVLTSWNSESDFGQPVLIRFRDTNHKPSACWRPTVGSVLASNNSVP